MLLIVRAIMMMTNLILAHKNTQIIPTVHLCLGMTIVVGTVPSLHLEEDVRHTIGVQQLKVRVEVKVNIGISDVVAQKLELLHLVHAVKILSVELS